MQQQAGNAAAEVKFPSREAAMQSQLMMNQLLDINQQFALRQNRADPSAAAAGGYAPPGGNLQQMMNPPAGAAFTGAFSNQPNQQLAAQMQSIQANPAGFANAVGAASVAAAGAAYANVTEPSVGAYGGGFTNAAAAGGGYGSASGFVGAQDVAGGGFANAGGQGASGGAYAQPPAAAMKLTSMQQQLSMAAAAASGYAKSGGEAEAARLARAAGAKTAQQFKAFRTEARRKRSEDAMGDYMSSTGLMLQEEAARRGNLGPEEQQKQLNRDAIATAAGAYGNPRGFGNTGGLATGYGQPVHSVAAVGGFAGTQGAGFVQSGAYGSAPAGYMVAPEGYEVQQPVAAPAPLSPSKVNLALRIDPAYGQPHTEDEYREYYGNEWQALWNLHSPPVRKQRAVDPTVVAATHAMKALEAEIEACSQQVEQLKQKLKAAEDNTEPTDEIRKEILVVEAAQAAHAAKLEFAKQREQV